MIKDSELIKEDLSAFFKSNPKEWEILKVQILEMMDDAKNKACTLGSGDYDKGIVEGYRRVLELERYFKKWQPQKTN